MRTLVVVRSLKMGGMERVAVNLADAFAEAGHESHLLTFRKAREPLTPEHPNVRLHAFSLHWALRLTVVGALIEALSRWFLNPLFRRSLFVWMGFLGGYLFRAWLWWFERRHGRVDRIVFRGVGTFELVWSFRDERARHVLENIMYRGRRSRKRKLFARCLYQGKHLVAVSQGVAENVEKAQRALGFTPASLSVIVNPCPMESIRRLMQEPAPEIPDQPYIVNVARLVPAKDQALLLRAYAIAAPRELLVLVGAGQERARLEALAEELGIREKVIFAGQQANPYPWMRHARLFVLSSSFEGMGIVLFEALACGTPVLSVDCPGGIREILKGPLGGAIVPHDAESLAEGMRAALQRGEKPTIDDAWLADFRPQAVVARFLEEGQS
ncbi:glycosyltransferase [Litchfieldella rifensis]|uniref:Glycosyltransferase n=1 Tax=Litchfieldella rifensis TaxID=762643 RepID=A0ABV7LV35_9GAMM